MHGIVNHGATPPDLLRVLSMYDTDDLGVVPALGLDVEAVPLFDKVVAADAHGHFEDAIHEQVYGGGWVAKCHENVVEEELQIVRLIRFQLPTYKVLAGEFLRDVGVLLPFEHFLEEQ